MHLRLANWSGSSLWILATFVSLPHLFGAPEPSVSCCEKCTALSADKFKTFPETFVVFMALCTCMHFASSAAQHAPITNRASRSRHAAKCVIACQEPSQGASPDVKASRRGFILRSCNLAVLADTALNQSDGRTIVNSLLGMILSNSLCAQFIGGKSDAHNDWQVRMACRS